MVFFSAFGPLVKTLGATLAKTLGLAALAGTASEGASHIVKKISGGGQKDGFIIPYEKIAQLLPYKSLFTQKQKRDMLDALETGSVLPIRPTMNQVVSGLGTILASIGILMIKKLSDSRIRYVNGDCIKSTSKTDE